MSDRSRLVVVLAASAILVLSPVWYLGLTTAAGYVDCKSGTPIFAGQDISDPNDNECEPWDPLAARRVSNYDTKALLYYAHGHGRGIREYHGHLALIDVIWARLLGDRPVVGGRGRGG